MYVGYVWDIKVPAPYTYHSLYIPYTYLIHNGMYKVWHDLFICMYGKYRTSMGPHLYISFLIHTLHTCECVMSHVYSNRKWWTTSRNPHQTRLDKRNISKTMPPSITACSVQVLTCTHTHRQEIRISRRSPDHTREWVTPHMWMSHVAHIYTGIGNGARHYGVGAEKSQDPHHRTRQHPRIQLSVLCLRSVSRYPLRCVAVCCGVLRCVAVYFGVLQFAAVFGMSTLSLQYLQIPIAVCCSVVQSVVLCCGVLQWVAWVLRLCSVCRYLVQRVTVSCSVLRCVAVCCGVPQCVWWIFHLCSVSRDPFSKIVVCL